MTELMSNTGRQSSRKIFKHTFPCKSIFGWYILVLQSTLGGEWG